MRSCFIIASSSKRSVNHSALGTITATTATNHCCNKIQWLSSSSTIPLQFSVHRNRNTVITLRHSSSSPSPPPLLKEKGAGYKWGADAVVPAILGVGLALGAAFRASCQTFDEDATRAVQCSSSLHIDKCGTSSANISSVISLYSDLSSYLKEKLSSFQQRTVSSSLEQETSVSNLNHADRDITNDKHVELNDTRIKLRRLVPPASLQSRGVSHQLESSDADILEENIVNKHMDVMLMPQLDVSYNFFSS
jgi:hypothetical protein